MDKNLIKFHIKKLSLTKRNIVPNLDFASLYDRVMPTFTGELGVVMSPPLYSTNPCLEVTLPVSGRNVTFFEPTTMGIEPQYQRFYSRRDRGFVDVDPVTGCIDLKYGDNYFDDYENEYFL